MPVSKSTYHSSVYLHFKEIEAGEFREIVRYYEENAPQIQQLEFEEYFELQISYLNALFEVGSYTKHIKISDQAITTSILHNIKYHKGEDIYQKLLFRKAASHYNLLEFDKARHILRELTKMNPYDEAVIHLLRKCTHKEYPAFIRNTRALSIVLFLLAALIISVEVLVVRTFFPVYASFIETTRNIVFFLSCTILFGGDLWHYLQVRLKVNNFVAKVRQKRVDA